MHRLGQFALFVTVVVAILGGIHVYLWARLIHGTALPAPWSRVATVALILLGVSLPSVFLLSRALGDGFVRAVLFVPYL
jgi:hypothetical protein